MRIRKIVILHWHIKLRSHLHIFQNTFFPFPFSNHHNPLLPSVPYPLHTSPSPWPCQSNQLSNAPSSPNLLYLPFSLLSLSPASKSSPHNCIPASAARPSSFPNTWSAALLNTSTANVDAKSKAAERRCVDRRLSRRWSGEKVGGV